MGTKDASDPEHFPVVSTVDLPRSRLKWFAMGRVKWVTMGSVKWFTMGSVKWLTMGTTGPEVMTRGRV
jgi:hypothetical protein